MEDYRKQILDIAEMKDGWGCDCTGKPFSKLLIERCERIAEKLNVKPRVRPTLEGEICFDYDTNDINVEIVIDDNGLFGFVTKNDIDNSVFTFDTEESAINFWNIFIAEN